MSNWSSTLANWFNGIFQPPAETPPSAPTGIRAPINPGKPVPAPPPAAASVPDKWRQPAPAAVAVVARPDRLREGDSVFSAKGQSARLGPRLATGGEGHIFRLDGKPEVLIKVYKTALLKKPATRQEAQRRIEAMCSITDLARHKRFAWPRYPVFNDKNEFVGFGMAMMPGSNLHALGSLTQIREQYPDWNRLHLARIAANVSQGISFLHAQGVIVGDLNPGNIQYSAGDGKVFFIDCDSYQLDLPGASFPCPGYVDLFAAPEVLAARTGQRRPPESEAFSASILFFMLLMFGLHPFARRGEGDPVSNMRTGASPWAEDDLTSTPMGAWNGYWHLLPFYLKAQFQRAFRQPRNPSSRPTMRSWNEVLTRYHKDLQNQPRSARIPEFPS